MPLALKATAFVDPAQRLQLQANANVTTIRRTVALHPIGKTHMESFTTTTNCAQNPSGRISHGLITGIAML